MKQARGLRNNNPLNIIKSEKINWQGEVKPSTDPNFAQFETLEYGLRAALKLLRTYYQKHGCRTIRQIVARWDPEGPKVIDAYVNTVCKHTGLTADQQLPPMKEGDEGDVVRHRAGYGNDGVRTERETAGRAGAFHRPRVGDEMKPHPRPLSFREGRKGDNGVKRELEGIPSALLKW